jgi:hypothetical protein
MNFLRLPVYFLGLFSIFYGLVDVLPATATPKSPPPEFITAVDLKNNQISITYHSNGQVKTYTIDDGTEVKIGDATGSIKDIKVGQQVFALAERDASTLDSITVGKPASRIVPTLPGL